MGTGDCRQEREGILIRASGSSDARSKRNAPRMKLCPRGVDSGLLLLDAEVGEDLGLCFIDGQQVVAGGAVLGDALAVFGGVLTVVAAEAAGIAHVADVV